jgi:hypothetical protein
VQWYHGVIAHGAVLPNHGAAPWRRGLARITVPKWKKDLVIWGGRIPRHHRAVRCAMIPWRHALGHRASKLNHSKQILVQLATKVHIIKVPKREITVSHHYKEFNINPWSRVHNKHWFTSLQGSTLIHEVEFKTN